MSQTEQLSLLVRFVWNGKVEERLLTLMPTEETTAEALFVAVTQELQKHGIDLVLLRGQCYDGANNVAGVHTGLQARVKEISPSALYTHCYAHVTTRLPEISLARYKTYMFSSSLALSDIVFMLGIKERSILMPKEEKKGSIPLKHCLTLDGLVVQTA